MRRSLTRVLLVAASLALASCDYYYNDVPSPDALMHLVPWFDAMIKQSSVHAYQRADIPRNTVPGTVPITGGEADWLAEWSVGDTKSADRLVNPMAGQGNTAVGDSVFHNYCAICHGDTGAGNGPVGPKMGAPSLLTDKARGYTDGYLYSIIRYGRGVMPRYGDKVRGTVRWAVVNHLRALQVPPAPAPPAPGGPN